jgi:S-adenosylhomocysteine hydrolase
MKNKIYSVPREIDQSVAKYSLDSMNIEIDTMTKTQRLYIDKWE